ncbi:MAG: DNA repair protein RecN [Spirochaetia bacterium]|nr:DNA repair protein RecN [Spirochaetia bacterium]
MLDSIQIRNYALIRNQEVTFERGFTVLTGETGSGKTVFAGALRFLFGAKPDTGVITEGEDETTVTGTVDVGSNAEARKWLADRELESEDGTVILRRTLRRTGKGTQTIQGVSVTRGDLEEFASLLIDAHAQHEQMTLLKPAKQRQLLDRYARCLDLAETVADGFNRLCGLQKKKEQMHSDERERARELDLLRYGVEEIRAAALRPGEEEEIESRLRIIGQAEKVFSHTETFSNAVAESSGGALKSLRAGMQALRHLSGVDERFNESLARFEAAFYELEDVAGDVQDFAEKLSFDPETLETLQSRLHQIRRLESKYGDTVGAVLEYARKAEERIAELENYDSACEALEKEQKQLETEVLRQAVGLSQIRRKGAVELEEKIQAMLRPLGMKKAVFKVRLDQKMNEQGQPVCTVNGFDTPVFCIAPNEGEALKPLSAIASGGELSRILLSVKSVFVSVDNIETMLFDEVDSGVGGEVALTIASRLEEMALRKQVLCITHSASIAARAEHHILIRKEGIDGRTVTRLEPVTGESRVSEIARMLAGNASADISLSHARELLRRN